MKKQFTLIAWITLIMTLLLSSCQRFEGDAIQKLAYGKDESGRHFVDLGLSVKWATCNIGAETPEQQGLLYAWGETTPKEEYTWDNYKFGPDTALSKYCAKPDVAWHGFTDAKTTLELSDDAAHVNWRGRWRMPTQAEWKELIEKCTWTQTEYMGVKGYDVKATNGNRIFLPAPDENALYASSSLIETRPGEALHLPIFDQYDALTAQYRYRAYSVRAVYGPVLPQYCLVNFDANGGEGIMHPQQFSKGALIPLTEVRFTKQASVFSSWNTKADGSGTSYTDRDVVSLTENITLYAQWKPCYTITFDANGGEGIMDSLQIVQGEETILPANVFTRNGYMFTGWNTAPDGSGTAYKESSKFTPTENMTLYAQWKLCYTITFDANGGEGTMDSLTIVSGEEIELPANTFTRNGYMFIGWNTAPDGSGISYKEFSEIEPTQNMTLYAQWTPCYTITFDANGGEGRMSPQRVAIGKEFSISSNTFTRSGYSFTAWNTKADGSGTSYVNNQVIILSQDITLYAQWMEGYYESGYEYVDLGLPSGTKWATYNVGATKPEDFGDYFAWGETEPKTNYTWSTYKHCNGSSSSLIKYNTNSNYGMVDNKTVLDLSDDAARVNWGGRWRMPNMAEQDELRSNCTWIWTTQNGVKGYEITSKVNRKNIFLPAAGYDVTNLYDVGSYGYYWSSSLNENRPNCAYSILFRSGGVVSQNYDSRSSGYTVRAVFSEKDAPSRKFIVVFNANGGSGTMSAQQIMAGVSRPLSANTFTRSGYTFVGWNTAPDGSGTSYTDKQVVTLTEDITLYAQWKQRIFYSVTFKANGGIGTMADQVFEAGVSQALVSNAFIRDGYTFIGWNTTPDGSGTSYTDKQVVTLTEDLTLYAQWEQRFYVSFEANGGHGEMEVQTFVPGETKALLACDFSNSGYMFTGWNTEADGSGTSYSDKQIISVTQDLTLYAQWKRGIYTVTFDANGGTGFMSAQTFEGGVSQALSTNVFTREGFLFDGWNTKADGSGTSYTDKEVISLTKDITLYAQWTGYENGHEWVDLGLPSGLKWATCNIGATTPEGYGDYFAWGETEPKSNYAWDNYKFGSSIETFNKYNSTDKKTILEPEDDAAHVNWGGNWQMPLSQDFKELLNNCTSVWTKVGYVNGYKLTSKINGNSIFLPAAGYKYDRNWVFENSYAFYRAADKQRDGHSYAILGTYGDIIEEETLWMREACSIRPIIGTGASVTFNANGGTGTMLEQRFEEGVSQQLSPNTFTRDGYTFVGWNTKADGSGTSYTDMQEISLTRNTTLFAQWKPYHEYYVTFDANGGEGEMEPQLFLYGIRKPLMENSFTREGYVFVEWNREPDGSGTTYQDQELTSLYENITLYAQWAKSTYTLTFDANGGEGNMPAQEFEYGVSQALNANGFTRANHAFIGWNTASNGNGTLYTDQQEITITQDITLYAQWEKATYTLTFDANGGEGSMPAQKFEYGVSQALNANGFTRANYAFIGWNTASNGSGTLYTDQQEITLTQDITLYAQWKKATYTLTFDANGGEGSMPAQEFEYGVSQSINTNLFTRYGYVFNGWNTASNGNGTLYTDQQEITITQDITLYAQWKRDASFGEENGYEWVDLSLPSGLKWATCNVGATTPEGYGDYFAWGETSPKSNYTWETYKFLTSGDGYDNVEFNKYNTNSDRGTVDNKTTLDLSDDAARANWGGTWRTPTKAEQDELRDNCTWTWTTQNGVNGYKIASKTNGNNIFLPAAGYSKVTSVNNQVGSTGYYWSISLDGDSRNAHYLRISSYKVDGRQRQSRDSGLTVRAVCP